MNHNKLTPDQLFAANNILVAPTDPRTSEQIARYFGLLALQAPSVKETTPQISQMEQKSNG